MSSPSRFELLRDETLLFEAAPPGRGRAVLLFPNSYHVGMSSLALHTVYAELNRHGLTCERAFAGGSDTDRAAKGKASSGTRSLESDTPLAGFDFVLVSSSFELDWLHLPRLLAEGGLPPLAEERDEQYPIVIAGGPAVTQNPWPLADIIDVAVIGEFEPIASEFSRILAEADTRDEALAGLVALPGVWLPGQVEADARAVQRLCLTDLAGWDTASVLLTPHTEFSNRFLVEVSRGCGRGCNFCLARQIYHPFRIRRPEQIIKQVKNALQYTDLVGLVGAAVSDYPWIDDLVGELREAGARLSVSSVRAESATPGLLQALADSGQDTLTLAPEAGSEELRRAIGKELTDDDLRRAITLGLDAKMRRFKLYFMVGLPGETDETVLEIVQLVLKLREEFPAGMFSAALGAFVPKPHTPFAREAMTPEATLQRRIREVTDTLRRVGVRDVTAGSARWAEAQTVLSRGGRELSKALVNTSLAGGKLGDFRTAVKKSGGDWNGYLARLTPEQPAPWELITS